MKILNRSDHVSVNTLLLILTLTIFLIILFYSPRAHSEVAVFPNSYIYNDGSVRIVTGQPHHYKGKTYYYTQTRVIPINPALDSRGYVIAPKKKSYFCPPGQQRKGRCQRWRQHRGHDGWWW